MTTPDPAHSIAPGTKRRLTPDETRAVAQRVYQKQRRAAKAAGKQTPTKRVSWRQAATRILAGSVGLLKVSLGIDAAEADVVAARLAICEQCPLSTPQDKPVLQRRCGKLLEAGKHCGCWLSKKPKLAGQSCPLGKW